MVRRLKLDRANLVRKGIIPFPFRDAPSVTFSRAFVGTSPNKAAIAGPHPPAHECKEPGIVFIPSAIPTRVRKA